MEDSERLFGIRCEDGGVIACESSDQRDTLRDHMKKANGKGGCRIPADRLHRVSTDDDWVGSHAAAKQ